MQGNPWTEGHALANKGAAGVNSGDIARRPQDL
jgi:hypothetical protein